MIVNFYRTALCPRCNKAEQILQRLMPEYPQLELGTIEVATRPVETFRAGIRMIPALKCGDEILSGVLLKEEQIREFLNRWSAKQQTSGA
ncbi:MAG: thioredoxin family protein [Desulfuromonadaceae bacterium]|nr:thioredoxin family protein [Desulfuromonadaceae bacterium]